MPQSWRRPESIEEVVAAQIDQLTPPQRRVLRHAAVLGSQFETAELTELLPDLGAALDELLHDALADFLVPADDSLELRFRHGLIREVAYQGLAYRARRRMHDQVGLALERTQATARPGLLSFHFLNAGRYDKAWTYARTAGDQARKMYANTEATELLSRAVEAGRRLPRGAVAPGEIGLVLESLGDCWFTIGSTSQRYSRTMIWPITNRISSESRILFCRLLAMRSVSRVCTCSSFSTSALLALPSGCAWIAAIVACISLAIDPIFQPWRSSVAA